MSRLETFNRLAGLSFGRKLTASERVSLFTDVLWERAKYGTEI